MDVRFFVSLVFFFVCNAPFFPAEFRKIYVGLGSFGVYVGQAKTVSQREGFGIY